jgi:hypothetical protein
VLLVLLLLVVLLLVVLLRVLLIGGLFGREGVGCRVQRGRGWLGCLSIAHHAVVRDRQDTQTGDLASNNLKGKRRSIKTSLVSEARERSALQLPDISLDRTRAAASNAGSVLLRM